MTGSIERAEPAASGEPSWSAELRAAAALDWDAAVAHPFVGELCAGRLPATVLARYLVQDYQFADGFTALLGAAVAYADAPAARLTHARQLAVLAS
jgi:thiaminase/transcriptional activator TenA